MDPSSREGPSRRGTLRSDGKTHWVEDAAGTPLWEDGCIWSGYVRHWKDRPVLGRYLPARDYGTDRPMVLLWPEDFRDHACIPHFQLLLNERLTTFRGSLLGHTAVNVGGCVFNFSYRLNENEAVPVEEYLYRPALGCYGAHPTLGRVDAAGDGRPYYNNFGRLFERSIHVLHVETTRVVVSRLFDYFHSKMEIMRNAPVASEAPNRNPLFHYYRRNCATIIRDGLRRAGPFPVRGMAPRDLFESAGRCFLRGAGRQEGRIAVWRLWQLKVPEAPYSVKAHGINPLNRFRDLLGVGNALQRIARGRR